MITELLVAVAISTATNVEPLREQDSAAIQKILTPPINSFLAQFESVVKLIKTRYNTQEEALSWVLYIYKYTKKSRIHPKLFAALVRTESYGNPNAISVAGAAGLTQVIPTFWSNVYPECGLTTVVVRREQGFMNPETSICYGASILNFYIVKSITWYIIELIPGLKFVFPVVDMNYALNMYSGFAGQYANRNSPYSSRITRFFDEES